MKSKHHIPSGREDEYIAWCEVMAKKLGTTTEDLMAHVDFAIDASKIPEWERTPEQEAAYAFAKKAGFVD
jgi:hypothetical protein